MSNTNDDRPTAPALVAYTNAADAKSPRAAWFDLSVKETAKLYAERQGYTAVETSPEQVDLVKAALAEGESAPNGKITLYAVKRDVLERLLATLAGEQADAPGGSAKLPLGIMPTYVGSSDDTPVHEVPVDPLWGNLAVNMVVLAPEYTSQGRPEGWWEAVITAIRGDVFTLRFRDYPRQPPVHRKRDEVAIMYPPPVRV